MDCYVDCFRHISNCLDQWERVGPLECVRHSQPDRASCGTCPGCLQLRDVLPLLQSVTKQCPLSHGIMVPTLSSPVLSAAFLVLLCVLQVMGWLMWLAGPGGAARYHTTKPRWVLYQQQLPTSSSQQSVLAAEAAAAAVCVVFSWVCMQDMLHTSSPHPSGLTFHT